MAKESGNPKNIIDKGIDLNKKGKYEEAVKVCSQAIELDPTSADAWLCKCNGLKGMGKDEEALECYNQALKIDPKSVQAWVNKGNLLFKMHREDEAIEAIEKARKARK
ncbi:MAG: tetratricopeptide repeat protein [Methanomicrobiales archaeon]|nr:tetratricopeptide repeat protein [Methanomicrobiales archaeon]